MLSVLIRCDGSRPGREDCIAQIAEIRVDDQLALALVLMPYNELSVICDLKDGERPEGETEENVQLSARSGVIRNLFMACNWMMMYHPYGFDELTRRAEAVILHMLEEQFASIAQAEAGTRSPTNELCEEIFGPELGNLRAMDMGDSHEVDMGDSHEVDVVYRNLSKDERKALSWRLPRDCIFEMKQPLFFSDGSEQALCCPYVALGVIGLISVVGILSASVALKGEGITQFVRVCQILMRGVGQGGRQSG